MLDELLAADPHDLPGPALGAEIAEVRRQANRADALYLKDLFVFDQSGAALADHGSTQAWARSTLLLSPARASRDVHLARDLMSKLTATWQAMADGRISIDHAQVIASINGVVSDEHLAAAEPHLIDAATWKTPQQLRKSPRTSCTRRGPTRRPATNATTTTPAACTRRSRSAASVSGPSPCTPPGWNPS